MLGFELDFWDYVTFATAALAGCRGRPDLHLDRRPARTHRARAQSPRGRGRQDHGLGRVAAHRAAVDPGVHLGVQAHRHRRHPALPDAKRPRRSTKRRRRLQDEPQHPRATQARRLREARRPATRSAPPTAARRDRKASGVDHAARLRPAVRLRLHRLARLLQVQVAEVHDRLGLLLDVLRAAPRASSSSSACATWRRRRPTRASSSGRSSSRRGCRSPRSSPRCWSSRTCHVKRGTPLFQFDRRIYESKVRQLRGAARARRSRTC